MGPAGTRGTEVGVCVCLCGGAEGALPSEAPRGPVSVLKRVRGAAGT